MAVVVTKNGSEKKPLPVKETKKEESKKSDKEKK